MTLEVRRFSQHSYRYSCGKKGVQSSCLKLVDMDTQTSDCKRNAIGIEWRPQQYSVVEGGGESKVFVGS